MHQSYINQSSANLSLIVCIWMYRTTNHIYEIYHHQVKNTSKWLIQFDMRVPKVSPKLFLGSSRVVPNYLNLLFDSYVCTTGLAKDLQSGSGLHWYFGYDCSILKLRPVLNFSSKMQGSFFTFFGQPKNEFVRPKMMFFGNFSKNSIILW